MSVIHRTGFRPNRCASALRMSAVLRAIYDWSIAALRRRRTRQQLARLDDHMLRDIGLTRLDIARQDIRSARKDRF